MRFFFARQCWEKDTLCPNHRSRSRTGKSCFFFSFLLLPHSEPLGLRRGGPRRRRRRRQLMVALPRGLPQQLPRVPRHLREYLGHLVRSGSRRKGIKRFQKRKKERKERLGLPSGGCWPGVFLVRLSPAVSAVTGRGKGARGGGRHGRRGHRGVILVSRSSSRSSSRCHRAAVHLAERGVKLLLQVEQLGLNLEV